MFNLFKRLVGWATPIAPDYSNAAMANRLGHLAPTKGERGACRSRKQGNCPGLEFCEDCQWSEGDSRNS